MALTADYDSNYVQVKEGAGKGKTFHRYNITGTKAEIKEYTNSPQFKAHPRHSATGQPQFVTMFMDALKDKLPLYKKQDGNYTLDGSETRKDLGRAEMLEQASPALAAKFADTLVSKISGRITAAQASAVVEEGEEKEIDEL